MPDWLYKNKEFIITPKEYVGFVYEIYEKNTDMYYIGKKLFWSPGYRQVNKKKKKYIKESDWKKYYGSSKLLKESITINKIDNYIRKILRLCKTKGEMSYYEIKEQIDREVLFNNKYYNNFIGCKIHGRHLKGKKNNEP